MNTKQEFFLSGAALVNDITFLFNCFLFFSFQKTNTLMWIEYIPWVALAILALLINRWFLLKPKNLLSIVLLNVLLAALFITIGFKFVFRLEGVVPHIYAVIFLIYTVCRAAFLSLKATTEKQIFIYTEFSVLGTGFFFFTQTGNFNLTPTFNLPCILSVAVNIVALIWVRIFGENSKVTSVSKWQGNFAIMAIVALIGGAILSFFLFLSSPLRVFLIKAITVIFGIIKWIGFQIGRLILFIISLLPHSNINMPLDMQNNGNNIKQGEDLEEIPVDFVGWLLVIAGFAVLVICIILVIKYWGKITGGFVQFSSRKRVSEIKTPGLFKLLMKYLSSFIHKVEFWIRFFRYRNTSEGVYVLIELWGKREGIARERSETPAAYLKRLVYGNLREEKIVNLILRLIAELEDRFYGGTCKDGTGRAHLSKKDIQDIRKHFIYL